MLVGLLANPPVLRISHMHHQQCNILVDVYRVAFA
jgi:hypothetical protein